MINLRGAIFLAWLLTAPPVWKSTVYHYISAHLATPVFYTYWGVWIGIGGYLYWLLVHEARINRPLKAAGRWLLNLTEPLDLAFRSHTAP